MQGSQRMNRVVFGALKYVFLLLVTIMSLFPILWVILSSLKTSREIVSSPLALPLVPRLDGYRTALEISPLFSFYGNSIIVSVAATVLNVLLVGMAAYVFARSRSRLNRTLMAVMSVSLFIPVTSMMQSIYSVIRGIGLYDTKSGLILVYVAIGLPITLFIMRSFFLTISHEIEESAYMDGAGFLRTFLLIVLPIARPGLATAGILQFLACWNEFLFALTLTTSNASRTLPLSLNYFTSIFNTDYSALFAAITMIILPSIVLFALAQEQVVSGLQAGSVKG
ncbi:carbohydrate ABC transporter permease [Paenibacillus sp. HN-1]|uniref:carbohydrate ABC transporter permease n=2 Tax=Paenibacillus TaxID=44249 RepID=UPI001CA937C5|nr:carbohydrate ABC transporter permease [Paenibacillus sp. CGMCC 1.18879]MBY9078428.1 carbohydrate ABC transporter permease [Paenibacillus sp. CGMCC 1.18879]MBY9087918.1 carbohydrate ABC transporter permease [Paenibacillus sinensis]